MPQWLANCLHMAWREKDKEAIIHYNKIFYHLRKNAESAVDNSNE